ncbi:MAG: hypothetical protein HRT95_05640 [Moritella sp.]|uniref:hypothetical protein n=1 Tax=Moritella sp. TaxID=78556 RepID=UPI001DAF6247|nr:hypothetical protein [Moritella sp.]NQZ49673.1 hypothetical protein [Moritella sp.]
MTMVMNPLKQLEQDHYYTYPNRQTVICSGVTIRAGGRFYFSPIENITIPKFSNPDRDQFFETLKSLAGEYNVKLPEDLGVETNTNLTGITVKSRVVSIRPLFAGLNGQIEQPAISFSHKDPNQFNDALRNAKKTLRMYQIMKHHIESKIQF